MEDAIQLYEINGIDDIETIFYRVLSGEEIHIENLKLNFLDSVVTRMKIIDNRAF